MVQNIMIVSVTEGGIREVQPDDKRMLVTNKINRSVAELFVIFFDMTINRYN